MRSVPSAVADGCSDRRLPIADFQLVSSDRANWQSAIETWQCRNPSATADGTDFIATARPFTQSGSLPAERITRDALNLAGKSIKVGAVCPRFSHSRISSAQEIDPMHRNAF